MAEPTASRPAAKDPETAARMATVRQRGTRAELLVRKAVRDRDPKEPLKETRATKVRERRNRGEER